MLFSKKCVLVFSAELLEEFLEVTRRPKFRRFFPASDVEELLETIQEYADFVEVTAKVEVCRDTKDNFFIISCS
ncbi:putative toxin-antitoxin system toxin component, PIN family [Pedobacter panaciterrae]|uniref:putative toxin-antitoxin system toxin component, PIN family n=1 Tax=Pedobacter panaciterrae TaxID=363849 RepID=UPI003D3236A7